MESDCTVNNTPKTLASMEFGVEVIKLHVLSCVHHFKCFAKVNLMESGDGYFYRTALNFYSTFQDSFYCLIIFLI